MSDLSKRLRGIGNECVALGYASLRHNYFDAADELDRLNAQALELCAEISGLRRENEALKGLLRELLTTELLMMPSFEAGVAAQDAWADRRAKARDDAAAALAGTANQPTAALHGGPPMSLRECMEAEEKGQSPASDAADAARWRWLRQADGDVFDWLGQNCMPDEADEYIDKQIAADAARATDPTTDAP